MHGSRSQDILYDLMIQTLTRLSAGRLMTRYGFPDDVLQEIENPDNGKTHGIALGKAAVPMRDQLLSRLKYSPDSLLTIIPEYVHDTKGTVIHAGHPLPDNQSLRAGRLLAELARGVTASDRLLVLLSGGGSAMSCLPADPSISIDDLRMLYRHMLLGGLDIEEMNRIRATLSAIKGGKLARLAEPARVIQWILCDIPDSVVSRTASGPFCHIPSNRQEALTLLKDRQIPLPDSIQRFLESHIDSQDAFVLTPESSCFRHVRTIVIGTPKTALETAERIATENAMNVHTVIEPVTGEAFDAGITLFQMASERLREFPDDGRSLLIAHGETTVNVTGTGRGGRNLELGLGFLSAMIKRPSLTFELLSIATDGRDGVTNAAGVAVNPELVQKGKRLGLDPLEFHRRNDSLAFFEKAGGLITTGESATNLCDLHWIRKI